MKTVLFLVGSLRRDSVNRRLATIVARHLPEGYEARHFDIGTLPLYNGDFEGEHTPTAVQEFRQALRDADGVYWTLPEYNFAIPGVVKNALDWASRPMIPLNAVVGKPMNAAVATLSPTNGVRSLNDLKRIWTSIGGFSATSFDFVLHSAATRFVDEGDCETLDQAAMGLLRFSVDALVRAIEADAGAVPLSNWEAFAASIK